jgi:hypothetical protein
VVEPGLEHRLTAERDEAGARALRERLGLRRGLEQADQLHHGGDPLEVLPLIRGKLDRRAQGLPSGGAIGLGLHGGEQARDLDEERRVPERARLGDELGHLADRQLPIVAQIELERLEEDRLHRRHLRRARLSQVA